MRLAVQRVGIRSTISNINGSVYRANEDNTTKPATKAEKTTASTMRGKTKRLAKTRKRPQHSANIESNERCALKAACAVQITMWRKDKRLFQCSEHGLLATILGLRAAFARRTHVCPLPPVAAALFLPQQTENLPFCVCILAHLAVNACLGRQGATKMAKNGAAAKSLLWRIFNYFPA